MTYGPATLTELVADGTFPETTRVLRLEEGTVGNASFLALPVTAGDQAGAQVVANLALSPEQQAAKADPAVWGQFTVLDVARLDPADQRRFDALPESPRRPRLRGALPRRRPRAVLGLGGPAGRGVASEVLARTAER